MRVPAKSLLSASHWVATPVAMPIPDDSNFSFVANSELTTRPTLCRFPSPASSGRHSGYESTLEIGERWKLFSEVRGGKEFAAVGRSVVMPGDTLTERLPTTSVKLNDGRNARQWKWEVRDPGAIAPDDQVIPGFIQRSAARGEACRKRRNPTEPRARIPPAKTQNILRLLETTARRCHAVSP